MISGRDTPYDDNGHGTSMAGILVADGGLKGMAIDVNLYVAKALTETEKEMTKPLVTQLNGVLLKKLTSYRYHWAVHHPGFQ